MRSTGRRGCWHWWHPSAASESKTKGNRCLVMQRGSQSLAPNGAARLRWGDPACAEGQAPGLPLAIPPLCTAAHKQAPSWALHRWAPQENPSFSCRAQGHTPTHTHTPPFGAVFLIPQFCPAGPRPSCLPPGSQGAACTCVVTSSPPECMQQGGWAASNCVPWAWSGWHMAPLTN